MLKLTSTLSSFSNYKIYANNFFTSLALIEKLKNRGMLYTGTAQKKRLFGLVLMNKAELKKKGRGSFDHKVEQNNNIVAVRWMNSKPVTILSSWTGFEPMQQQKDGTGKRNVKNHCPCLVLLVIITST